MTDLTELETPCLLLDLDRLERNLQRMREHCRSKGAQLRPHLKTAKSIDVARLAAAGAPLLPISDPIQMIVAQRLSPPSAAHWLGQDEYGRDVLSRLIWGARTSLFVATAATCIAALAGTLLGLIGGWFRGIAELFTVRVADVVNVQGRSHWQRQPRAAWLRQLRPGLTERALQARILFPEFPRPSAWAVRTSLSGSNTSQELDVDGICAPPLAP